MSPDRIETESSFQIPEMPRRVHIPALIRMLDTESNPDIIEARDYYYAQLYKRGITKPKDLQPYREYAAAALWFHRNDKPRKATGKPSVTHSFEVGADAVASDLIPGRMRKRAVGGAILHDAVENNPYVNEDGLKALFGHEVADDVRIYSKKRAADKVAGIETELTAEEYLHIVLTSLPHRRVVKVADRMRNMGHMPPGALEMYDRYFRKETELFVQIILSLGRKGKKLYEEYRITHNENKPEDVPSLPPFKDRKD